jgi:glycosyltransferase involved in cell wall biosynthesis
MNQHKMKILHVFDFFSPSRGGGTVGLVKSMAYSLAKKGHQVEIVTGDFQLDEKYIASIPGVKVNIFHCTISLGAFFVMPALIGYTRDHLKEFDIIHLHAARSFQNIVIHHYARKYKIPYIFSSHGSLLRTYGTISPMWFLKWLFDILFGYRLLKDCSVAMADSVIGIDEYKHFGVPEEKIVVVHAPLPVEGYQTLPQRGLFRDKYGLRNKKIIMFLGRIGWIKGIDFLVDGFARLARDRDDIRLVIVGGDFNFKESLEKQIGSLSLKDRVIFTGYLDGDAKLSALVDADVVVQPSRYEHGTWVPFEAVLCNTPILVSSHTGSGADVKRIDAGYLVEFGNLDNLTQMLNHILDNPEEAGTKAKKAGEYIRANLSMTAKIEEYEKVYLEAIGRRI